MDGENGEEEVRKFLEESEKLQYYIAGAIGGYCKGQVMQNGIVLNACLDIFVSVLYTAGGCLDDIEIYAEEMIRKYEFLMNEGVKPNEE